MTNTELLYPQWPAPKRVRAFSTTRTGGCSQGPYSSLNLGMHVSDDPDTVADNRAKLMQRTGLPAEPLWLNQVHGTAVHRLQKETEPVAQTSINADACITRIPNAVCCVMTADCLPVFMCDSAGTEVAVVHAGWRGMAAGVLEQAVQKFSTSASDILAWAGPAISVEHFEVGQEVKTALGGSMAAWRASAQAGKYYADLYRLAGERLSEIGISWYGFDERCTYGEPEVFFSHRRDGPCGRQASLIYLADE